ncbi:transcriptional regulator [Microbacterium protaetiae]|uniref:Transcriptional regulator n=1 Tax=Microbacterium protaetiae TaxID=2509458 RepID=A0A4P6E9H1_9MICO|nr:helix-turn-helix domain-containing protein [Microbacterium protaetiae]QAY58740.1 transcriptional regulator [Microbacterium protaetiae]
MSVLAVNRAAALAALADPVRRRIYDIVARGQDAVGRDVAAAEAALPRSTAAFHLDRLVDAGLLTVEYRRLSGRSGPGAGRPAKLYRAVTTELIGSIPERHYELAAELLAAGAERADREHTSVAAAAASEARDLGREIGADCGTIETALSVCGYTPDAGDRDGITLRNCPFHALADRHPTLVCTVNAALIEGLLEGSGDARCAHPVPRDGGCCVEIRSAGISADGEPPTQTETQSP